MTGCDVVVASKGPKAVRTVLHETLNAAGYCALRVSYSCQLPVGALLAAALFLALPQEALSATLRLHGAAPASASRCVADAVRELGYVMIGYQKPPMPDLIASTDTLICLSAPGCLLRWWGRWRRVW